jgi:hypothetical protein
MAQHNTRSLRAKMGALLLTLGILLMAGNVGLAVAGLPQFLRSIGVEAIGIPAAAALAILKFLQAIAFHPEALLPFSYGILVLFFALAGILSGLMLLRKRTVENA